ALANEKPNAIIVMLGLNDRVSLRASAPPPAAPQKKGETPAAAAQPAQASPPAQAPAPPDTDAAQPNNAAVNEARVTPGGSYEFHTDQWALLYSKRIDDMIAALKAKGVPVLWVGLPALRGTKSTSEMSYLDELYRERAEKAGITYVDIWDGFVDERGQFAVQGPDFEGQIRRLRTGDGVHFTKPGAVKLASYVDHELRRLMSNHAMPVALPGPEENAPPKPGVAGRPDVGPVVPLASSGVKESGGDLLGAIRPAQATADPVAAKVLSRGDSIAAPAGRADDFSWPRPGSAADATPDVAPQPVVVTPAPTGKKGAAAADAKKASDGKKDAKK
ncbi:MAG TPA: GDSL-type esterase/lipase family protein, partial [Xanthobacteraceae bacterium]